MFKVIKSKAFWLYAILMIVVLGLFSVAQVGTNTTMKMKQLPVALVNSSNGTTSNKIEHQLKKKFDKKSSAIKWIHVKKESELNQGFKNKKYYGAVVIKKDFDTNLTDQQNYLKATIISQKLTAAKQKATALPTQMEAQLKAATATLQKKPTTAGIDVIINQGMNATAANALTTALPQMGQALNQRITQQKQAVLAKQNVSLTAAQWATVNQSINVKTTNVHKIPSKSARGAAPMLLVVLAWFGSMIPAILLWREHKKTSPDGRFSISEINSQMLSGAVMSIILSVTIYLLLVAYGVPFPNVGQVILLLFFNMFVFYLIQTTVLDWTGLGGWPILIVIWIFSTSMMSYAPEMLGSFYRTFIYSWLPLRFSLQMFNNSLYYQDGSSTMAPAVWVILIIGVVAAGLIYLSSLLRNKEDNAPSI
ncbi:ABC transporter permease [Nicoliella spurrieriana]|uniref:ABC transporter permease n=1 Tax=Nicoliella spurrieriana TaxID=2925830 RepID=A0A976RT14_9LACO|nr:ABC transporter permease [Nicoliella spurrieriana]UQS87325.1 ABC transporter permease [Nicoliella spurrieriana]